MKPLMVGTHRWSAAEAALVDVHVAHVMALFADHPAAEVMMYDDDFRLARHRFQDRAWTTAAAAHLRFLRGRLVAAVVASAMGGSNGKALRSGDLPHCAEPLGRILAVTPMH